MFISEIKKFKKSFWKKWLKVIRQLKYNGSAAWLFGETNLQLLSEAENVAGQHVFLPS